MREKNISRAAEALFVSQGDDKNKVLASFIENKEASKRVKDQGRALLILERLCLPEGKFSFTKEEIHSSLLEKLVKKGHRIQGDEDMDTEEFAREKQQARIERLGLVDNILGRTLQEVEEKDKEQSCQCEDCLCQENNTSNDELWESNQDEAELLINDFHESDSDDATGGVCGSVGDTESDLPDIAWQLIGQAYIDGIRTGRNSK